jgi:hypothetical protein
MRMCRLLLGENLGMPHSTIFLKTNLDEGGREGRRCVEGRLVSMCLMFLSLRLF